MFAPNAGVGGGGGGGASRKGVRGGVGVEGWRFKQSSKNTGTLVAIPQDAWCYGAGAGFSWPGDNILWLGKIVWSAASISAWKHLIFGGIFVFFCAELFMGYNMLVAGTLSGGMFCCKGLNLLTDMTCDAGFERSMAFSDQATSSLYTTRLSFPGSTKERLEERTDYVCSVSGNTVRQVYQRSAVWQLIHTKRSKTKIIKKKKKKKSKE